MTVPSSRSGRYILSGTIQLFLAEALLLPTGIITVGFLTRQLGPEGYGLYTLAATLVAWVGWTITSVFTRTTIKFVGETTDWRPIGATVLRLHLYISSGAMLLLWLLADSIAALLKEPVIANYLRLFALDVPLFCLAYAHGNILVGIGNYTGRAIAIAIRWISRLILIVLLVSIGLSTTGAILGSMGASLIELIICRCYIRPSVFTRSAFPIKKLWSYTIPLFFFELTMRFYDKLDLFALKALGGTAAQAGFYGTAQNLSLIPGLFSLSFAPLLLSSVTRALFNGDKDLAKKIARHAMRAVLIMLPLAGLTAGAASEIVTLVFGSTFLPSAPLLSILIFGSMSIAMISITTAILTAADKPNWTFVLASPLLPMAIIGYILVIPQLGPIGASTVTAVVASLGASAAVLAVYRLWRIFPPLGTFGRSILICGLAYLLSSYWQAPGLLLFIKLSAITLLIPLTFLVLGEFTTDEIMLARSFVDPVVQYTLSRYKSR